MFPRETVGFPSLEVSKARLNGALNNLVLWKVTLLVEGGWNWMICKILSNSNHFVILQFHYCLLFCCVSNRVVVATIIYSRSGFDLGSRLLQHSWTRASMFALGLALLCSYMLQCSSWWRSTEHTSTELFFFTQYILTIKQSLFLGVKVKILH